MSVRPGAADPIMRQHRWMLPGWGWPLSLSGPEQSHQGVRGVGEHPWAAGLHSRVKVGGSLPPPVQAVCFTYRHIIPVKGTELDGGTGRTAVLTW